MPGTTPLKIFIASSGELISERKQAVFVLERLENAYTDLHLKPILWEYAMARGSYFDHENIQAAITPKLQESDLAVFIFYSKPGIYTLEEFECAKKEKKKTLVFFKDGFSPINEAEQEAFNQLKAFKSSLSTSVLTINFDTPAAFEFELYANIHLWLSEKNKAIYHCTELNNLPNIKLAEFVGRTNELNALHSKIIQGNRVLIMNGIGGVGKTTLAKKYVQEHKQEYNHAAFVEVKLPDDNTDASKIIPACMDAFANDVVLVFNLQLQFDAKVPNEVKFNIIINKLRNLPGKGLLVLDNLPLLPAESDIMDRLPAPPGWTILVTSRNVISGLERYDLDTLSPVESITLFKKFYTGNCTVAEINELLQEIGYHTLTTELLAKTLQNTDGLMHITMLTEKIKSKKLDDAVLQEKIFTGHHNKGETTVYLHLSKALSMAHLNDAEKWIMKNFAFLMPANYTTTTLIEWLQVEENEQKQFKENLRSLLQKGWLQQKEANSYTMHRILQQLVQYQLMPVYDDVDKLVNTLQKKLDQDITTDYLTIFEIMPYTEYFLQLLDTKIYEDKNTAILLNNLGLAYHYKGNYDKAMVYYEKALKIDLKFYDKEHPAISTRYNNIGFDFHSKGEYNKAIVYFEKALKIDLKFYGEVHPNVATRYNNLGAAYRNRGEHDKAIEYYEKALKIHFKFYGEELRIADCYNNLGLAYDNKGKYDKAIEYYEMALDIDLKFYGEEHPSIATRYNNLGLAYRAKGEYDKAIEYYKKALKIDLKFYGEEHIQIAIKYINVGGAYYSKGEYDKAIEHCKKGLLMFKKFLSKDHPNVQIAQENLDFAIEAQSKANSANDAL